MSIEPHSDIIIILLLVTQDIITVKPIEILREELLPTVLPCINELLQIVKNDKEYEVSFLD